MMQKMPHTTSLSDGMFGAAAIGRSGFFMCLNGFQRAGMLAAAGICRRGAAALNGIQGAGVYTMIPSFAVRDGIGAPRRQRLKA